MNLTDHSESIPLSLYVHIPWCIKKCPYCDFNSHEIRGSVPEQLYIDALINDLHSSLSYTKSRQLVSIFIGGGTPSLFSWQSIKRLLQAIEHDFSFAKDIEITIEANPGSLDEKNFSGFREAGVNRISIGVQSFSDLQLQLLGRIHDAKAAIHSVEIAQQVGFENINIDLMYALPQQKLVSAISDVEQALTLNPTHISYYQLTLEPNTHFFRCPPALPNSQVSWEIQQEGMQILKEHGYKQYEVSAYSKPGHQCVHNINYWQFGDYLGIGAGAHQKLSLSTPDQVIRSEKFKHPQTYMNLAHNKPVSSNSYALKKQDLIFEFMLNALRLKQGFSLEQFELHTGLSRQEISEKLQSFVDKGLLVWENTTIHCSERGYLFLDDLLEAWLPQAQIQTPDSYQMIRS